MAEIYQIPETSGNANSGIPFSIPLGGNGGLFGNGQTNLVDLFGFAIIASMFPNFFGGNRFGGGFGCGCNGQNVDSALALQAVTSQGEANRAAIQNLANSVGQDYATIGSAVQNVQNTLGAIGAQQGMSTLQVITAIQGGNAAVAAQLQQCCCENRLLTTQQGYEAQIRTLEQTNQLGSQADRNNNAVLQAIAAQTVAMNDQFCALKERELQARINSLEEQNTQLKNQFDNANQTAQITNYINNLVQPLANKVNEIAAKQLPTVNVQYPQLTAVNTGAYTGGGFFGNGFGNNVFF